MSPQDYGLPGGGDAVTPAHSQSVVNRYVLHFPDHAPRASDPHYKAFEAYRRAHIDTAVCYVGQRVGFDQCADALGHAMTEQPIKGGHGLEAHHHVLEFSLLNSVDIKALEVDFPFLTDSSKVDEWAETGGPTGNLIFVCAKHHRGVGGVHHAAAADFEASLYVRNLIS